jgi:cytochrome c-type biogenesis protein CcmH/NrfG
MSSLDREGLEAERDFLLRSLDDLDSERETDNVDAGTYQQLRDDYTARAAATIRSLDEGADLTPPEPPAPSRLVRAVTVVGIVAFALVAAFLLTRAVGQRRPGQTITGNNKVSSGPTTIPDAGPALAADAKAHPGSYAANIAYARYLLQNNDFTGAIHEFGTAARLDPSQPEPPTYAGWAGALLAQPLKDPATRGTLLAASLERIDEVIKAHPQYPDAYALKGVILFKFEGDAKHAIPQFRQFLQLTDDSNPIRSQVLAVLAQAERAPAPGGSK